MHKKSIEALDKLKVTEAESDSQGDSILGSQSSKSIKVSKYDSRRNNCSSPAKSIASSSESSSMPASPAKPNETFSTDLRRNSIAALRAKAIEHSAKVLQDSLQGITSNSEHSNLSSTSIYSLDRPTSNPNFSQSSLPYPFSNPTSRHIY